MVRTLLSAFGCTAALLVGVCSLTHADLSYAARLTIVDPPSIYEIQPPAFVSHYYFRNDQELAASMIPMPKSFVYVVDIDKPAENKHYTLDRYTSADASSPSPDLFELGFVLAGFGKVLPDSSAAGVVTCNVNVKDAGTEKIDKKPTRHFTVTLTRSSTGNVPIDSKPRVIEIWTDDTPRLMQFAVDNTFVSQAADSSGAVHFVNSGDVDAFSQLLATVPVRMRFTTADGRKYTIERMDLSTHDLKDDLFEVPKSDKQLSSAEFAKEVQKGVEARVAMRDNVDFQANFWVNGSVEP